MMHIIPSNTAVHLAYTYEKVK